jgi:hypothetical protein
VTHVIQPDVIDQQWICADGVDCPFAVPTVQLSVNPLTVQAGGSATISWSSTDTTSCVATGGWTGSKPISGSQSTGALTQNTTFVLVCSGSEGEARTSVTVTVTPAVDSTRTLLLGRQTVGVGAAFVYAGQYPTVGRASGRLSKIALDRGFGPLLAIEFVKPGHDTTECNDPKAVVQLRAGETLSGQSLIPLFGEAAPPLPVRFVACAVFNPPVPQDVPAGINMLITISGS